jgi:hypothetical protein
VRKIIGAILAGLVLLGLAFGCGAYVGARSRDIDVERANAAAALARVERDKSIANMDELRSTLDSARERSQRIVEGIDGAISRATITQDRNARIVSLTRALRTVADGLRGIYEP